LWIRRGIFKDRPLRAGGLVAYTGKEVTWDFALKSKLDRMPKDLRWDMALPVGEPAVAGRTPLV
jgi:hypothetical protein